MIDTLTQRTKSAPRVSPALGLLWLIWRRQRAMTAVGFVYIAALAAVMRTIHLGTVATVYLACPLIYVLIYLIGTSALDPSIAPKEFSYPRYLLVTPVKTRTLVFWPMLYGAILAIAAWIWFVGLVASQTGWTVPEYWSPIALVALCAWFQTLCWLPIRSIFAKLLLLGLLLLGLAALGYNNVFTGQPPVEIQCVYLAFIGIAYLTSVVAVSMARRGVYVESGFMNSIISKTATNFGSRTIMYTTPKPLKSKDEGQFWFEWTGKGAMTLLWTCVFCFLPVLVLYPVLIIKFPIEASTQSSIVAIHVAQNWELFVNPNTVVESSFAVMAGVIVAVLGLNHRPQDLSLSHRFFEVRPITSASIITAKLKVVTRSSLCAAPLVFLWLLLPAGFKSERGILAVLLAQHASLTLITQIALSGAATVYLVWKLLAGSLFMEFLPKKWRVRYWIVAAAGTILYVLAVRFVQLHGVSGLVDVLVCLAILKATLFAVVLKSVHSRRLLGFGEMSRFTVIWCLALIVAEVVVVALVPSTLVAPVITTTVVFLLMPGATIALAPLAVEWDRHQ
jgi:hypothetical protein